jgi:shikimate kinase
MRIFLTGFMGAGKSFLGKLWAEDNNIAFYDLDILIEEEERTTIDKIFSEKGEAYFRELEAAVLRNTERLENAIIACGGGAPCFFDNMYWMNKNGTTVFLNESVENIFHHLVNDKKQRPLLLSRSHQDLENIIREKLEERLPFYNQCKIILTTENLNRNGFKIIDDFLKSNK